MISNLPSNGNECSNAAADSLRSSVGRLEKIVLDVIRASGGLTTDQVEEITGLSHQTASARASCLLKRGLLRDSGVRKPTRSGRSACVWMVAEQQTEFI